MFVGRRVELARLGSLYERALEGAAPIVVLVGEPGIGKTRMAHEFAVSASGRGACVLWGRCYERQGAPPYWPWVQAVRSYVRTQNTERLRSEIGAGAAVIAEVVAAVRERLGQLGTPPALEDPRQARFRLFDALTTFLRTVTQTQPVVLVLEDLHWADAGSLLLLEFFARELPGARLLLIGTYRDLELSPRHPLVQTLAELTRDDLVERIPLSGQSENEVGRFVAANCALTPPPELVNAVYAQTEGNPLFLIEVVRLLTQEGHPGGSSHIRGA